MQDAFANTVASTAEVKVALAANPGGATLAGNTAVQAVGGIARFTDLNLNQEGTGYTLTFSSDGLTSATSTAFNVAAGSARTLSVTAQPPASTTAGAAFSVAVAALDSHGNTAKGFNGPVTVALGNNAAGATLLRHRYRNAVKGLATFTALSVDKAGTGYTLSITSTAWWPPPPARSTSPRRGRQAGLHRPAVRHAASGRRPLWPAVAAVAIHDACGNPYQLLRQRSRSALTNAAGATLSGTATGDRRHGVATFSGPLHAEGGHGLHAGRHRRRPHRRHQQRLHHPARGRGPAGPRQPPRAAAPRARRWPQPPSRSTTPPGTSLHRHQPGVTVALGSNPGNGDAAPGP